MSYMKRIDTAIKEIAGEDDELEGRMRTEVSEWINDKRAFHELSMEAERALVNSGVAVTALNQRLETQVKKAKGF